MKNFYFIILLFYSLIFSCQPKNFEESLKIKNINNDLVVCADSETINGIDVSYYQGNIDWNLVKESGIQFAFIRVSDGLSFIDPKFEQNWIAAKEAGIVRGVYQFFRPARDPILQAELLLEKMGQLEDGDLPPVIDVEAVDGQTPEQIANGVRLWIETVESATGRKPIIYSGKYFWNDYVKTTEFSDYPFWIAQYGPTCPDLPLAWNDWLFFQTSSDGNISGIIGDVDTNLFNGNLEKLLEFVNSTSVCGDGFCSNNENVDDCSHDCKPCQILLADQENIIDERSECFVEGGPQEFLRQVNDSGYNNTLIWTHTTDFDIEYNYGEWHLYFSEAGKYRIEVFIEPTFAESKKAKYEVVNLNSIETIIIDQTILTNNNWHTLGEFYFGQGNYGQKIKLVDNTGEPGNTNTQLIFDAIKIIKINDISENNIEDFENFSNCSISQNSNNSIIILFFVFILLIVLLRKK